MKRLFENKTMLISGGLGDIGRATCDAFAAHGAAVALCGTKPEQAAEDFLASLGSRHDVRCRYDQVDVSNAEAVKNWISKVEASLGIPTLIIANAATVTLGGIHEITPAQWQHELHVNLNGAFYMAQEATRKMVAQKRSGHVIFIGSWAAHAVHKNMPAYCVSKAGMRMLCRCMALELAPYDILVNEVAPGYVQAGLSGKVWEKRPELKQQASTRVPTGRIMTDADVAREVLHLCHPDNKHITGSTLLMDGGLSLSS